MMYRIILICLFAIQGISLAGQDSQTYDIKNINSNLDALFQYCFDHQLFNGSVLIFKEDEILFEKSYGVKSLDSIESVSKETPFLLASLSKQFTAFAMAKLHTKGKLNYDDLVSDHLIDFPYPKVTIRHLLNHTSGIPEYTNLINPQFEKFKEEYIKEGSMVTNASIDRLFQEHSPPLNFPVGSNFDYSNTGYLYLALIIEAVSGQTYAEYLGKEIFSPLGMDNSWASDLTNSFKKDRAQGFKLDQINKEITENESPSFFKVVGDGGIYCSSSDLQKWFTAIDSGLFIDKEELEEAYRVPIINEEKGPYGFGWFVRELPFNNHKALTHSGQFVGFTNSLFRDLDDGVTSIILSNNSHEVNGEINGAVVRIIYGMPFDKPKLSLSAAISNILFLNGITEVKTFYELNKNNELYDFSEKALNGFGYDLLSSDKLNDAIAIFEWNVELNPHSANVYDSLGEAYMLKGEKTMALENYKKAYELDPSNENAEKLIKKLKTK